jgi:large subunit ribosomal protein L30
MAARLRLTLTRSVVSQAPRTRATLRALGLRRMGHTVEVAATPATRGMARAVGFMLRVEEIEGTKEATR